jgi:hypothetical protein
MDFIIHVITSQSQSGPVRGLTDVAEGVGAVRARAEPEIARSIVRSSRASSCASPTE